MTRRRAGADGQAVPRCGAAAAAHPDMTAVGCEGVAKCRNASLRIAVLVGPQNNVQLVA